MNWKLIFQLSLFGLAMGIGTVFFIPSNIEPIFWLVLFLICAYVIARSCADKYFLHGFFLGLVNCVWVTSLHIIFFFQYFANHPREAAMMESMGSPRLRLMMALFGPVIGIISGVVIGLFGFVAGKIVKPARAA